PPRPAGRPRGGLPAQCRSSDGDTHYLSARPGAAEYRPPIRAAAPADWAALAVRARATGVVDSPSPDQRGEGQPVRLVRREEFRETRRARGRDPRPWDLRLDPRTDHLQRRRAGRPRERVLPGNPLG